MSRRLLYLCGGWRGHNPGGVAGWLIPKLDGMGFSVDLTLDPEDLGGHLEDYSLVVIGWTQSSPTERLDVDVERNFVRSVANGLGVAGWHGMAASFRASLMYNMVVGGNCVCHPGGEGVRVPYEVRIDPRSDHPVLHGVRSFPVASEQYYMHADANSTVLAETVFSGEHMAWLDGLRAPAAWVRDWGRGRVFYMSPGHYRDDLEGPDAERLLLQGIAWSARRSTASTPVDGPAEHDHPSPATLPAHARERTDS